MTNFFCSLVSAFHSLKIIPQVHPLYFRNKVMVIMNFKRSNWRKFKFVDITLNKIKPIASIGKKTWFQLAFWIPSSNP